MGAWMLYSAGKTTPCHDNADLFYGSVDDGRTEPGRQDREDIASSLCFECPLRLKCLEGALVQGEEYGVWGGMGEGERRKFKEHLLSEGYQRNEIPTGAELAASVNAFYRYMDTPHERMFSPNTWYEQAC